MLAYLTALTLSSSGVESLLPAQRSVYQEVIREEFCSCDSALTLSGCLQNRPTCATARHLSRLVALGASSGSSTQEILGYLSERVMGPFCAKPALFQLDGAPTKGPSRAKITVVEFADFRCGHCARASQVVKGLTRAHPEVRFVFVPFPLQDHPLGIAAAEAAFAAQSQGKFWAMHDALFALQEEDFEQATLLKAAKIAELDVPKFKDTLGKHPHRDRIRAFKEQGIQAGVMGTPSFFVNGRPYELDEVLFTFADRFAMEKDRKRGQCQ